MLSLSEDNQSDVIETFNSTSRYLDDLLNIDDFITRNMVLTAKLLRRGYRYHKLRKAFSKFYRRHFDIALNIMSD